MFLCIVCWNSGQGVEAQPAPLKCVQTVPMYAGVTYSLIEKMAPVCRFAREWGNLTRFPACVPTQ